MYTSRPRHGPGNPYILTSSIRHPTSYIRQNIIIKYRQKLPKMQKTNARSIQKKPPNIPKKFPFLRNKNKDPKKKNTLML